MKTDRQHLGALGENLAAEHYIHRGGLIKQRNVSYPCGEIDLIVEEPDGTVVFVEVKTRRGSAFGVAESVTPSKMNRLRRAAARWLERKPFMVIRFDVIAIVVDQRTGDVELHSFEGVDHGAR